MMRNRSCPELFKADFKIFFPPLRPAFAGRSFVFKIIHILPADHGHFVHTSASAA